MDRAVTRLERVQALFVLTLAVIVPASFALIWWRGSVPAAPPEGGLIVASYRSFVAPKPVEQFVFLVMAAATPLLALGLAWSGVARLWPRWARGRGWRVLRACLPLVVALLLFLPLVGSTFVTTVVGRYDSRGDLGVWALAGTGLAGLAACLSVQWFAWPRFRYGGVTAWAVFLVGMALQLFSWRLVGLASVTRSWAWAIHADPVFYALSQVVAGRTLLADLPSQYGLFPELLAPLFRLTGLSVGRLSAVFAIMQVVSLLALFDVLARRLRSRLVLGVAGLALLMVTFETVLYLAGIDERYYQYWPTRFFWPAASVWAFDRFLQRPQLRGSAALSALGVLGTIWNFDSGVFIVIAYGAYLCARLVLRAPGDWSRRRYAAAILLHAGTFAAGVGLCWAALALKADRPLDPFWLFGYQRIFYGLGLMMLDLPRAFDPWMSVLGVYLLALLAALCAWRVRPPRAADDLLFYLAMLGLGLFVYYEGRSHVLNLVTVCWPCVLILALAVDRMLPALRARLVPFATVWLAAAGVAPLLLAASSFVVHAPGLAGDAVHQFRTRGVAEEPFVQSELALIERHAGGHRACLILARRQGILYAQSGLASPVPGPGLVETLLQSDADRLVDAFLHRDFACVFYGVGGFSDPGLRVPMAAILERYAVADRNEEGSMLFLVPRR